MRPAGGVASVALAVWCCGLSTVAAAAGDGGAALSPVGILLAVKRTYRGCESYRDSGEVRTSGAIEGGSFTGRLPFATAFVRGRGFRFEFVDQGLGERESRFILWSDMNEVRAWWEAQGGERRVASLREGLGAASGISGGASLRVPGLLLPQAVGEGFFLAAPERLGDENERGVACYRLRGRGRETPYRLTTAVGAVTVEDEVVTVWIDRATFLLRKVEERRRLSTYRTVTTTLYEGELDVEIPPDQLTFAPPSAAESDADRQ